MPSRRSIIRSIGTVGLLGTIGTVTGANQERTLEDSLSDEEKELRQNIRSGFKKKGSSEIKRVLEKQQKSYDIATTEDYSDTISTQDRYFESNSDLSATV